MEDEGGQGINPPMSSTINSESGAAFVYRRQGDTWSLESYVKASNSTYGIHFGTAVALSADGLTAAVGAPDENSGVPSDPNDHSQDNSGAVYVFVYGASGWSQQAYLKVAHPVSGDNFGDAVALSADGNVLAVGAQFEDGRARTDSGAVYVFNRQGGQWSQVAYVKASVVDTDDQFGTTVALSADGSTLAVGAWAEDGNGTDTSGDPNDNSAYDSGAVYVFTSTTGWSQVAYLKPHVMTPPPGFGTALSLSADGSLLAAGSPALDPAIYNNELPGSSTVLLFERKNGAWSSAGVLTATPFGITDHFGASVALSADGNTLVVGAPLEDSLGTGPNADPTSDDAFNSGAAYVLVRNPGGWTQMSYLKASNTRTMAMFGGAVTVSGDARLLAIGAPGEDTLTTGVGAAQNTPTNYGDSVGAAYVMEASSR
jgi:hypothetical protein